MQAGVLIFPPEAPDPHGSDVATVKRLPRRAFRDRHLNHLAADLPAALAGLRVHDRDERVRVDRFDEPVTLRVGRHPERPDVFGTWYAFLDVRVRGAVVDERSARRVDEIADAVQMASAQFRKL